MIFRLVAVALGLGLATPLLSANETSASFRYDVVPVLSKNGCNGGGCHGKSEGQNGFRLSLLGFEPAEDYDHIVVEARGRRVFPAAPENSLLLLKATGEMPHGGGARIERGSPDYQILLSWLKAGMPKPTDAEPRVTRIEVTPREKILAPDDSVTLRLMAFLDDGAERDVTALARFESNDPEMAKVSPEGTVHIEKCTGDVAVMVRFADQVDVFRATVPLGAPVENLPPARNFIDELVWKKLQTLGLPPSEVCDDSTFLRRVTLDLAGRLPTADEATAFLADAAPDKRSHRIDALLTSEDYADFFAGKWTALLRNKRKDPRWAAGTVSFHGWVRDQIWRGTPYHEWVAELLTATGAPSENPPAGWYREVATAPEQLQDVAQLFAGTRLQCAQCHHHPYEKWSQQDYYGFAAFFSTLARKPSAEPQEDAIYHRWREASAENPRTHKPVRPTLLGGAKLDLTPDQDPRQPLADWLTAPENPFFARVLVNRYWKHFFGRALVEPEDDLRVTNPATNPALLESLAKSFTESGTDLRALCRTICNSATYQLAATPNAHNVADRQNFSRFYPRRLPAEVLLDAIDAVTGVETKFASEPLGTRAIALPDDSFNAGSYFLSVFGRPDNASACECERANDGSLAIALHLLNAKTIQEKLSAPTGRVAALVADTAPLSEKLGAVYMSALTRRPTDEETETAADYLAKRSGEPQQAWEDIVWALLNTKEFLFNH
ncbi:MAG: DUF1549 and DUF1553 domain-containing protein [Chthoniobacteraceae bacterium]